MSNNTTTNNYQKSPLTDLQHLHHAYVYELKSNNQAQKFLNERGVTEETINDFGIGFSSSYIKNRLTEVNRLHLQEAELFNQKGNDRNWRRITFPIHDEKGNLLGFNGRKIEDVGESPKYLLPVDSKILSKSEILFNLNQAAEHIRKEGCVFLVEGVMDVLAMHQAGFKNTVCVLGSSINEKQIAMLHKYTDQFVLAYDGDIAGFKAHINTSKLIHHILSKDEEEKVDIKQHAAHVNFKDGNDPGNFLKKPEALKQLITSRMNGVEFTCAKLKEGIKFQEVFNKLKGQNVSNKKVIQSPITKQVLEQINIVDVVRHYVPDIKKRGRNYLINCILPSHKEKTPSMSISPEKQIFKCFGCDCGGNAITLVKVMEDVTYKEALVILKERYDLTGINLDRGTSLNENERSNNAAIFKQKQELLEFVSNANHYTLMNNTEKGQAALSILASSGINEEMVIANQLGLASKDRTILAKQIAQNDESNQMMPAALKLGIIIENNGILESSLTGITKPVRDRNENIVGLETYTSKNIEKLKVELVEKAKKQQVKKGGMAL